VSREDSGATNGSAEFPVHESNVDSAYESID
jgi:hypothetical protein